MPALTVALDAPELEKLTDRQVYVTAVGIAENGSSDLKFSYVRLLSDCHNNFLLHCRFYSGLRHWTAFVLFAGKLGV